MSVKDLWVAVLRRWRGAVLLMLVVVGTTAWFTAQAPRVYESRTTVYFAAADEDGESTGNLYQMPAGERATLARIARSPLTLDPVRDELGLDPSVPLQVEARPTGDDTALFDFVVRSDSPVRAAQVAEVVPRQLAEDARSYAPTLAQSGAQVQAQIVDAPTRSSVPVEPDPVRNLLLAALTGAMLGLAYALATHALDTRLRTAEDVERVSDRPVLSSIPVLEGKGDGRALYVDQDPFGPHAEAVRKLRTNLTFVDVARDGGHSFVVTSALPGEGKTTTVVNLALAMAEGGRRVLVIDADLRRPTVAEKLGLEGAAGLTSVLSGDAQLDDVLQRWGDTHMYVLSGGDVPPNPSELLGSKAMENLFYRLLRDFDFVLVDSPPVLPVTDALVMSRLTGGVLMVVSTATRRRHLQEALKTLRTSDVRLDGFVLTKTVLDKAGSYYQYYGSRERAARTPSGRPPRSRQEKDRPRRRAKARA